MREILIFSFWLLVSCLWLYWRSRRSGYLLSYKEAVTAFLSRVCAGCVYGYYYLKYAGHPDTWVFFGQSHAHNEVLKHHPLQFPLYGIIENDYGKNVWSTFFADGNSLFTDLHDEVLIKLMAIFNLFSGSTYYTNVILYNWIVWGGSYLFYQFLSLGFPASKNIFKWIVFFYPPLLFWTGGIHRDGLCFTLLAIFLLQLYGILQGNKKNWKNVALVLLSWGVLLFLRNFWALILLPAVAIWWLGNKYPQRVKIIFASVPAAVIVGFFATLLLPEHINLPLKLAQKQWGMFHIGGSYLLGIPHLQGSVASYVTSIPYAVNHVFLRAYPWEYKGLINLFSLFEQLCFWGCFLIFIRYRHPDWKQRLVQPIFLSLLFICLSNYLIIGLTVPYLSAIIRYKSVFETIWLLLISHLIDWKNVKLTNINKYHYIYKKKK